MPGGKRVCKGMEGKTARGQDLESTKIPLKNKKTLSTVLEK